MEIRKDRIGQKAIAAAISTLNEKTDEANELKILLPGQKFCLENIPFKRVSDFELKRDFAFSSIRMRQMGLQFGVLSQGQQSRLNYFLDNYTRGEI